MAKPSLKFDPTGATGLALALRGLARLHAEGDAELRRTAITWIGDLADPEMSSPGGQSSLRERGYLLFGQDADKVDLGMTTAGEAHGLGLRLTVYDLGGYHYRVSLTDPMQALGQFVDVFSIRPARPVIAEAAASLFATAALQIDEVTADIIGNSAQDAAPEGGTHGALAVPAALAALIAIGAGAPATGLGGLDVPRGRRGTKIKDQLKALQKSAGLTAKLTPPAMAQAANLADRLTADAIAAFTVADMIEPAHEGGAVTDIHTGATLTVSQAGDETGAAISGGEGRDSLAGGSGDDSLGARIPSNLRLTAAVGAGGAPNRPYDVVLVKVLLRHTSSNIGLMVKPKTEAEKEKATYFDGPIDGDPDAAGFYRAIALFRANNLFGKHQVKARELTSLRGGKHGSDRLARLEPQSGSWATLIAKSRLEGQNNLRFAGDSTLIYRPQDPSTLARFIEGLASYTALHGDWAGMIKAAATALYDAHGLLIDFADGTSTALAKRGGARTGAIPGLTLTLRDMLVIDKTGTWVRGVPSHLAEGDEKVAAFFTEAISKAFAGPAKDLGVTLEITGTTLKLASPASDFAGRSVRPVKDGAAAPKAAGPSVVDPNMVFGVDANDLSPEAFAWAAPSSIEFGPQTFISIVELLNEIEEVTTIDLVEGGMIALEGKAAAELIREFGIKGKVSIIRKHNKLYAIFKGYADSRKTIRGTRYLASNASVVSFGVGQLGRKAAVMAMSRVMIISYVGFEIIKELTQDEPNMGRILGSIGISIAKGAIAMGAGYLAGAIVGSLASSLLLPVGVAIVIGVFVGIRIDLMDEEAGVSEAIKKALAKRVDEEAKKSPMDLDITTMS